LKYNHLDEAEYSGMHSTWSRMYQCTIL